jgi:hypothetical protein
MQEQWSIFDGTHKMRDALLDSLSDADLAFNPGGLNMTFGELCREMGEIEHSYVESLKTLKQDFKYRNQDAGLEKSVSRLKDWFHTMDAEMKSVIEDFSDADLKKPVERGFPVPVEMQMQVYLQAVLIFFGKATIFLRAMNRPLSQTFQDWIG